MFVISYSLQSLVSVDRTVSKWYVATNVPEKAAAVKPSGSN